MKFPWLRADDGELRRGCLNPQQVTGFAPCTCLVLPGAGAAPLWALVRGYESVGVADGHGCRCGGLSIPCRSQQRH